MRKEYTGHKELLITKKNIVEHLRSVLEQECQFYGVEMPRDEQVAVVVSALRMHHTLVHASEYDYSELGKPDKKTTFYPTVSSIGRYFRDSAGEVLREYQWKKNDE